jgi:hypothetical protein
MRKLMRDTSKNGVIVPAEMLKLLGQPVRPPRKPLLDLGIMTVYAPAQEGDDIGIVVGSDEAKAAMLTAITQAHAK